MHMKSRYPTKQARPSKPLTDRQKEILHLRSLGLTAKEVARELGISPDTVIKTQVKVAEKLHLKNSRLLVVLHAMKAMTFSILLCFSAELVRKTSSVKRSSKTARAEVVDFVPHQFLEVSHV